MPTRPAREPELQGAAVKVTWWRLGYEDGMAGMCKKPHHYPARNAYEQGWEAAEQRKKDAMPTLSS